MTNILLVPSANILKCYLYSSFFKTQTESTIYTFYYYFVTFNLTMSCILEIGPFQHMNGSLSHSFLLAYDEVML